MPRNQRHPDIEQAQCQEIRDALVAAGPRGIVSDQLADQFGRRAGARVHDLKRAGDRITATPEPGTPFVRYRIHMGSKTERYEGGAKIRVYPGGRVEVTGYADTSCTDPAERDLLVAYLQEVMPAYGSWSERRRVDPGIEAFFEMLDGLKEKS